MASSSDSQRGTYLSTGWRVVGANADQIVERVASAPVVALGAEDPAQTLLALQCTTEPVVRGRPTVERVLEAATEELRRIDADAPRLIRDEEVARAPSRFSGFRYRVEQGQRGAWVGELVWRCVHPVVSGAPITTRLLMEERAAWARFSLRVTADDGIASVRGYVGAGQVVPEVLRALRGQVPVTWMGTPVSAHPVAPGGIEDLVRSVLADPARTLPVALLSPLEEGGYVVDPADLAWDLLGRARLYVLQNHRQTFELSDAVGDSRMSCYWGAARCYFPGWTRHDDPFTHPLLVGERLADPLLRATWMGEVGLWMGRRIELPPELVERPAPPADDVAASTAQAAPPTALAGSPEAGADTSAAEPGNDESRAAAPSPALETDPPAHPDSSVVGTLEPLVDVLIREVQGLAHAVAQLTDEVEQLRTISAVRSSSTNAIERRLGRLEALLERRSLDASDVAEGASREADEVPSQGEHVEDEGRTTLVEVVHAAAEAHPDALHFLDNAARSAALSPYEDPDRVRAILEAMARVARRRRDGVLGTSLREAFSDLGIDYRAAIARNTPARLREQYRFKRENDDVVEAEEHIVLGNTYDPRRCLRIYFTSRVPNEPRFVVGHVGRHFEVLSST